LNRQHYVAVFDFEGLLTVVGLLVGEDPAAVGADSLFELHS
jgi:hypothetical protein